MANPAVDEAGNVWEVDDQGNPVRLITPAASTAGRVFSLPPNPRDVAKDAQAAARQAAADARAAQQGARADAQLELAKAANARAERAASGDPVANAKQMAEWRGNLNNIKLLEDTVKKLRQQYKDNFEGKGLQSIAESYAPAGLAPQYGVFETDANSMIADMAKAKGLTATQFNTPAEARMFFEPLIPKRGDPDEVIVSKLDNLERMIATGKQTTLQNLGMDAAAGKADQRADNEVPDPTTGAGLKPPPSDNSPPDMPPENGGNLALPTGGQRIIRDPRVSAQIDAMINAGAGEATINAALKRQNFPTINRRDLQKARQWMKDNPGQKYFGSDPTRTESLNLGQRVLADANVAPVAAGLARYADAATAGTVGALSGEEGRGALQAAAAMNPKSALAGDIAGSITGMMGAEAALAARAPAALARFAPRTADALFGGLYGLNTAQEGEGVGGAAKGAAAGFAGGLIGQRLMSGVGRATRGVGNANVGYLQGQGVPLTVGQVLGGSGIFGRGIKKAEDAMTSAPFVGNMVDARRMEGLGAFNRAAFGEAGAPIGTNPTAIGAEGIQQLRAGIGQAYDNALSPVQIDASDPNFIADLAGVRTAAQAIPNVNSARDAATAALDSRISGAIDPSGMIPGRNFQEAYRGLARTGRERANSDYGHEVGQVMRQGQDVLAGALEAQNPGAFGAFRSANSANRNANVIADAVNRAKNAEDEIFTPAQLNMADAQSARRLTGPLASTSGDRPFYDLASAGQAVLPSKLPDSGTWTRALVGGGALGVPTLAGAGAGFGVSGEGSGAVTGGLGTMLLLAAGGSRPAQRLLVNALTGRSPGMVRVGDRLVNSSAYGGTAGAGIAAPLFVGH